MLAALREAERGEAKAVQPASVEQGLTMTDLSVERGLVPADETFAVGDQTNPEDDFGKTGFVEVLRQQTRDKPIQTLAIIGAIGAMIGAILAR